MDRKVLDADTLRILLRQPEGPTLDLKSEDYELGNKDGKVGFVKDVLSMANTPRRENAHIVLGVRRNKDGTTKICGLSKHRDDNEYQNAIASLVDRPPNILHLQLELDGKCIGVVAISPRPGGPHLPTHTIGEQLKGGVIYRRRGSVNAEARPEEAAEIRTWFEQLRTAVRCAALGRALRQRAATRRGKSVERLLECAQRSLIRAAALDPGDREAQVELNRVDAEIGQIKARRERASRIAQQFQDTLADAEKCFYMPVAFEANTFKQEIDAILGEFCGATKIDPDLPDAHWGMARAHLDVSDEKRALQCLDRAIECDPTFVLALVDRASIRLRRIERILLEDSIERALILVSTKGGGIQRTLGVTNVWKSLEEIARDQHESAHADLKAATARSFSPTAKQDLWVDLAEALLPLVDPNTSNSDKALELLARCEGYIQKYGYRRGAEEFLRLKGTWLTAVPGGISGVDDPVDVLSQALNIRPHYPEALFWRGNAYLRVRKWNSAVDDFTHALEINPRDVDSLVNRGRAYDEQGHLARADADYSEAIRIDPTGVNAWINRAGTYLTSGRVDEALSDYGVALRLRPRSAEAHMGMGNALKTKGEFASALIEYDESLRLRPRYVAALVNRGDLRKRMAEPRIALADYRRAARVDPREPTAHFGIGSVLDGRGRGMLNKAIVAYSQAIRLDPKFANAYVNRGLCHASKQDFDAAIQDYDEALRIVPKMFQALSNRANAHLAKGDTKKALTDCDAALEINPDYAEAHGVRGCTLELCGDLDGSIASLRRAVQLTPQDSHFRKAREQDLVELEEISGLFASHPWVRTSLQASTAIRRKDYETARRLYEEVIRSADSNCEKDKRLRAYLSSAHYDLACIHSVLSAGKRDPRAEPITVSAAEATKSRDAAYQHLREAVRLGDVHMAHLRKDSDLVPLHDDPRWKTFAKLPKV